jgi:Spy/CpxP family protein refolding chaperone
MTRRVYLYFVATMVLGAILGGAGVYYFLWHTGRLQHPGGFNKDHAMARLKKVLNLSDAQAQQIGKIFDESSKEMEDLQTQIDPQFQAIHLKTRGRIRQVLDPDQARKFDDFLRQLDERHKRRGPPPPPPPS